MREYSEGFKGVLIIIIDTASRFKKKRNVRGPTNKEKAIQEADL